MLKALARVRELDISMICPGHGPVLDDKIDFIIDTYEEWSTVVNPNQKKTVVIPYVSAYGYTEMLAQKIAEGIKDSGDVDVRLYDMVTADQAKVLELAPILMGRQLDEAAGELLKKIAQSQDIQIHTGVQIASIEGEDQDVMK